jgi:hypothetical protein
MGLMTALAVGNMTATAVGGYMQYRGAKEQARTASAVADWNARMEEMASEQAGMELREQIRRDRKEGRRIIGAQTAAYGAAGVTFEGSPMDVLAETAGTIELMALERARQAEAVRRQGIATGQSIRMGGAAEASAARRAGNYSILSTAAQLGMAGANFRYMGAI